MDTLVLEEPFQKAARGEQSPVDFGVYFVVGQLMAADNLPICAMEMINRFFLSSMIQIKWA